MSIRILKTGIHSGEEPLVAGNERAGMVVFSGCHLSCSFCYTPETSVLRLGHDVTADGFATALASLLARGATNINLISPSHCWTAIYPVLSRFKAGVGAVIPLVLKVSGFESPEQVRQFAAVGDVLVPDFKVLDPKLAASVSLPKSYGAVALKAIEVMAQTHTPCVYDGGLMTRGMIVRHLIMPGFENDSLDVVEALASIEYTGVLNLMTRFIDPKRGLKQASPLHIKALESRATARGMTVLIDGVWESQEETA